MEKIMKEYKRAIFLRFTIVMSAYIFVFTFCTKDPALDENEGLLLTLVNAQEPLLTRTCLDWAKSEVRCVQDEEEEDPSLEDILKEELFPELEEFERIQDGESELSLCTKEAIQEKRGRLEQPESRSDDVLLKKSFRCLRECNQRFNQAIKCPLEKTFPDLEEYREFRDIGAGGNSLEFKECERVCFKQK
jgi:hypothetical protein